MPAQRCAAQGCGRFVSAGDTYCQRHQLVAIECLADAEVLMTPFAEALDSGDFQPFRNASITGLVHQAATDVSDKGIVDEIGALRLLLARLLTEQQDLDSLTVNVTRVTRASLQAVRVYQQAAEQAGEDVNGALALILAEIRDHRAHLADPATAATVPALTPWANRTEVSLT